MEGMIEMTGYLCELVICVIHSITLIHHVYQILIYYISWLKSYYVPVDVLDLGNIVVRMSKDFALIELTIYGKTASYRVEVMRYGVHSGA